MSRNLLKFGLSASIALAALGLSAKQSSAQNRPPIIVTGAGAGGAWPVWVVGGGVVSLMLRAAYVYNSECRELTTSEAITGTAPLWPVYHQRNDRCGPPPGTNPCRTNVAATTDNIATRQRLVRCPPQTGTCKSRETAGGNYATTYVVGRGKRQRVANCPTGTVFVPIVPIVTKY